MVKSTVYSLLSAFDAASAREKPILCLHLRKFVHYNTIVRQINHYNKVALQTASIVRLSKRM